MFIPVNTVENNTFALFITTVDMGVLVNTPVPILVIDVGIMIEVNVEQLLKALLSIVVTVDGIVIEDNIEQPLKADIPILVIP